MGSRQGNRCKNNVGDEGGRLVRSRRPRRNDEVEAEGLRVGRGDADGRC